MGRAKPSNSEAVKQTEARVEGGGVSDGTEPGLGLVGAAAMAAEKTEEMGPTSPRV